MRAAASGRVRSATGRAAGVTVPLMAVALAAGPVSAQSRIHAQVDTTHATVGDRITLTVTVDHPAGSHVVWPDSVDLTPFEVLDARASGPTARGDSLRSTAVLTLTAFQLGDLEIPSLDVEVVGPGESRDTLSTDTFGVEVASVGKDQSGDIRDIRGPLYLSLSLLRVGLWVLVALAVLSGGWWLWRRVARRRRPERSVSMPAVPPRPAHEVALEALERLEASQLLERGQVKEYHIELSDILRIYVEARFRVAALEMTSGEVLGGLTRAGVDAPFVDELRRFLEPCDLVKFAKVRPGTEASRALLALGRSLVESSIPAPEAPVEPSGDEPAGGSVVTQTGEAGEEPADRAAAVEAG